MAFLQFYSSLMGSVPELPVEYAKQLVNRAWEDIRKFRPWSFLLEDTVIQSPAAIAAGTAVVVQYLNQVTLSAAASVAVAGLANPILTLRQFRRPGGPVYSITAADFTNPVAVILTLDRAYQEATDAAATYQIYQVYFPAPSNDFLRWVSVFDPINSYRLKLHLTRQELDRRDPQRASQGMPYWVVQYKLMNLGAMENVPYFELWPHVIQAMSFQAFYQRRGVDLVNNGDDIPPQVCADTLMGLARYHAYEWAEANKGRHAALKDTNWLALRSSIRNDWKEGLYRDAVKDENTALQLLVESQSGRAFGVADSAWLQTHEGW